MLTRTGPNISTCAIVDAGAALEVAVTSLEVGANTLDPVVAAPDAPGVLAAVATATGSVEVGT